MANVIKIKRGTSTPTTSDITSGEVAIDTSAQKFYVNDGGTVKEIGSGSAKIETDSGETIVANPIAVSSSGEKSRISLRFFP